ncbi:hypothetical protein PDESU_06093 [Pontiella desulfatans]|uniref:Uncharacterized protein n=2 Tax=Pontiella desulfatans TaxID=2750659 RepID=A0A6C2UD62_PONDE|nr:hypothetical protein PDESU_06093 [Pontiella desulfatans]
MIVYDDYIPVPEIFWSFETGKPISHCSLCHRELMEPGTNYVIEKAFQDGETLFEHAICLQCHFQCLENLSEESTRRIRSYFAENVDLEHRPAQLLEKFGTRHERWLGHCMVKGYPPEECGEYQIYGFCIDQDLIFNGAPYMISGEAVDEILGLLSSETLGALGDISDRLFGIGSPKDLLVF